MSVPLTPLFKTDTVTAASPDKVGETGQRKLMAFSLYTASANSVVEFIDSADDSGTVLLTAKGLANTTVAINLTDFGGLAFGTALYCKPVGSSAVCYIWYQ